MTATRRTFEEVRRRVVTQVVRAPAWLGPGVVVTAVCQFKGIAARAHRRRRGAVLSRGTEPAKANLGSFDGGAGGVPSDASTVQVRSVSGEPPSSDHETGWLQLDAKARELLVVPTSSVLYSGDGACVLAAAPDGSRSPADPSRSAGFSIRARGGTCFERARRRRRACRPARGRTRGNRRPSPWTPNARLQEAQGRAEEVIE